MDFFRMIKELPSTAHKAIRDYFSGLQLFFNRQTWSHSVVFILTILFFGSYYFIQPFLRVLYWSSSGALPYILLMTGVIVFLGGCGAFIGFLLLGLIAMLPRGDYYLYKSRARHFISPLVIGGMIILSSLILPKFFLENAIWKVVFYRGGLMQFVFNFCWLTLILLQVAVLGYTVIKSIKWLWGYLRVPEHNGRAKSNIAVLILLLILIPIAILNWIPIIVFIMFGPEPITILPDHLSIPWLVAILLQQDPRDYRLYLLILCPLVILVAGIALWRRYPQVALALAGFGSIYPALVFYYRFRVIQYFQSWSLMSQGMAPKLYIGVGIFEMVLLFITFIMVLQGAAKLQRNISPNPFGLFALMIGALLAALVWVFSPMLEGSTLWFAVETFSMVSAALSAFLAVFVFAILPLIYCVYRFKYYPRTSAIPIVQTEE